MCVHKITAVKYVKQKLIEWKGQIDKSTITVGDFNTPLPTIDRATRQKVSKDIEYLNNNINQQVLTDIFRTLHPTSAEYT